MKWCLNKMTFVFRSTTTIDTAWCCRFASISILSQCGCEWIGNNWQLSMSAVLLWCRCANECANRSNACRKSQSNWTECQWYNIFRSSGWIGREESASVSTNTFLSFNDSHLCTLLCISVRCKNVWARVRVSASRWWCMNDRMQQYESDNVCVSVDWIPTVRRVCWQGHTVVNIRRTRRCVR